ncbi:MAG TPA: hypothetical protein ENJ95_17395, partial [Bacteroidetes bacterium]|nr:hypothetical protein [Bacteroidota bacterium]
MNFLLRNLELSLAETHLLVGEKLLEEGKVSSIFEGERNLWVAQVDGFETEMQITPTRVRACSCECSVFIAEKMCGHVAAGLLALRRLISEKKHRSKNLKKQARTYQKLTVNAILDQVGKEELSAFVRNYARGNRNFSIALKTRFAGAVPMSDNTEKYRQVLDSVIKSSRKKSGAISAAGAKLILATGMNLLGQATDSIALEHYADGWPVLKVMVNKIVPIASRIEYEASPFIAFVDELFELIQKLISLPIPPGLKLEIWDFLLEECVRPSHRGYNIGVHFYDLLIQLADDKAQSEILLATVEQELKKQNLYSAIHFAKLLAT